MDIGFNIFQRLGWGGLWDLFGKGFRKNWWERHPKSSPHLGDRGEQAYDKVQSSEEVSTGATLIPG